MYVLLQMIHLLTVDITNHGQQTGSLMSFNACLGSMKLTPLFFPFQIAVKRGMKIILICTLKLVKTTQNNNKMFRLPICSIYNPPKHQLPVILPR